MVGTVGPYSRAAEALEYGMVGVNTGLIATAVAPFGGVEEERDQGAKAPNMVWRTFWK